MGNAVAFDPNDSRTFDMASKARNVGCIVFWACAYLLGFIICCLAMVKDSPALNIGIIGRAALIALLAWPVSALFMYLSIFCSPYPSIGKFFTGYRDPPTTP